MNRHQRRRAKSLGWIATVHPQILGSLEPGTVASMTICHDDWCNTLKTNDGLDCNCAPHIQLHRQFGNSQQ